MSQPPYPPPGVPYSYPPAYPAPTPPGYPAAAPPVYPASALPGHPASAPPAYPASAPPGYPASAPPGYPASGPPGYPPYGYPPAGYAPPPPPKKLPIGLIIGIVAAVVLLAGAGIAFAVLRGGGSGRTYTTADVEAALLTLDDLPAGYTLDPTTDDIVVDTDPEPDSDADGSSCSGTSTTAGDQELSESRSMGATRGAFGPFVIQLVGLLPNGTTLQPVRDSLRNCGSYTDEDGSQVTVTEADYGRYGDETVAMRMTSTSSGFGLTLCVVMIRQGNLLSMVAMMGIPAIDSDELREIVRAAGSKLPD